MTPARTFIERVPADAAPGELARAIGRWKRRRRQGWNVAAVQVVTSGDVIGFGAYEPGAEPEPDAAGQLELDTGEA